MLFIAPGMKMFSQIMRCLVVFLGLPYTTCADTNDCVL